MVNERVSAFVDRQRYLVALIERMWQDPRVQLYNDEEMPEISLLRRVGSVFLAGPTSRHQLIEYNWRCKAVAFLREAGFEGFIFVPEPRGKEERGDFTERSYIHQWESRRLLSASQVMFWIPRNKDELLGLNTNLELGILVGLTFLSERPPTRLFVGWPNEAERMGLPYHYVVECAGCKRYSTLQELCNAVIAR